jgi:hypothetical protein
MRIARALRARVGRGARSGLVPDRYDSRLDHLYRDQLTEIEASSCSTSTCSSATCTRS